MKVEILISMALLLVAGAFGCGEQPKQNLTKVEIGTAPNQRETEMHEHHKSHGQHHQAFADPAKFADRWNNPERDGWQHPEEIIAAMAIIPGATVADIGAGTGYMVAHLSKAVGEKGTVIAIDIEAAMIEYLTNRHEQFGPATIVPRKASARDPDLQSESIDAVLTLNTWHHMSEREAYAKKVYAGLKRGGRFAVIEATVDAESGPPQEMRIEPSRVMQELAVGGFRVELVGESMPQHYMVVGVKD
jgi:ubiquinone/menaquinone biosynthesis C-methylase UbiE